MPNFVFRRRPEIIFYHVDFNKDKGEQRKILVGFKKARANNVAFFPSYWPKRERSQAGHGRVVSMIF